MNKRELWLRLKAYQFDHIVAAGVWKHITAKFGHCNPSLKAFAGKIAKKQGWKNQFALQAIAEYKKFIYLGLVSDFEVTPSKIIDAVWHEHLLFSKAYREFCTTVIEHPFDHHPELVPMADQTGRFSAQYLDTIALYRKEFGQEPPTAIWGDTKFDKAEQEKQNYQSNKKRQQDDLLYAGSTPLYTNFEDENPVDYPEFSGFEGGDFGGGGATGEFSDSSSGDSGSGSDGGGCSGGCGGGGD